MSDFEQAIQEARRLAATPQGQQLAAMLRQLGGPDVTDTLQRAAGDPRQAAQLLRTLLQDPAARSLLKQLGDDHG